MAHGRPSITRTAEPYKGRLGDSLRQGVSLLLIGCSAAACVEQQGELVLPSAPRSVCSIRVIVGFEGTPDAELIADVGRAADARLEVVGTLLPDLYVLALGADGLESACLAALERLRSDPRVRSADIDARRSGHEP
jgi:hypothetical protein